MRLTVSQPSDTGRGATLISDTGSGHLLRACRRGSGGCRRKKRFRTAGDPTGSSSSSPDRLPASRDGARAVPNCVCPVDSDRQGEVRSSWRVIGDRDAASFVQRWFWLVSACGWKLGPRAPVQGPSQPFGPGVSLPALGFPGFAELELTVPEILAAFGGRSGPDHAPRRPRSAAQDRAAPEHASSLPYWNHPLIQESVGRVAVAHPSAGPAPVGGPAGWCSEGSWQVGW